MVTAELAIHVGRVLLAFGIGSLLIAAVAGSRRWGDPDAGAPASIAGALTRASLLLVVFGWSAFPWLLRTSPSPAGSGTDLASPGTLPSARGEVRIPACLLMVGLAAAGVSARVGAELELGRLKAGRGGTALGSMMKRATFFFLLLSAMTGALLVARPAGDRKLGLGVLGGLSGLWVPAAIAWRARPEAGAVGPASSVAWRATFFSLALLGLASGTLPAFLGEGTPRAWRLSLTGLWAGIAVGSATLVGISWLSTRLPPRGSLLVLGLLSAAGGLGLVIAI